MILKYPLTIVFQIPKTQIQEYGNVIEELKQEKFYL